MPAGERNSFLYDSRRLGSYNRLNFEVRLDPILRASLNTIRPGMQIGGDFDWKTVEAFAVFFHETIHWWQHVGSTSGLMLSFAYPAQCHVNIEHLQKSLTDVGPQKSVLSYLKNNYDRLPAAPRSGLNRIVNNWHDVEFNCQLLIDPMACDCVVNNPFFECVGHSLHMGLSHTLWLLHASFDREVAFLPDARNWEGGFDDLRKRQVPGYFYGGKLEVVPLGARAIFEGQARFSEVQYLHLASGRKLQWIDFEQNGMFGDVYLRAFEKFREWGEVEWPDSPIHPVVQLFLLVCDLALNPSDGYPFELRHFESFIISDDPGYRFYWFSRQIAKHPSLKSGIQSYSKSEYEEIAGVLCAKMVCDTPITIASRVASWADTRPSIATLMQEEDTFTFKNENLPVRVCFAKHVRFMQDKASAPEFFCWPAMHFAEHNRFDVDLERSGKLWMRHQPLFMAELDGEIRPTLFSGKDEKAMYRTFNEFYRWNVLYDMTRQWITKDGAFDYDFSYLTPKYTRDLTKPFADAMFLDAFGISPDSFTL